MFRILCSLTLAISLATSGLCDSPDNAKSFSDNVLRTAGEYEILAGEKPATLRREPVLTWTNPEVGEIYGSVFVWLQQDRPIAIASMYQWYHPHTHASHEFQSLSKSNISAERHGKRAWTTSEPGIQWKPLDAVAKPGGRSLQRLIQMRSIAKRFKFEMTERDGVLSKLRLLTQPLLRYASDEAGVQDGAIFAFAKGTDPEALLLVEAYQDKATGESHGWRYAIARSNFLPLKATFNQSPVWEVPRIESPVIYAAKSPYAKMQFDVAP